MLEGALCLEIQKHWKAVHIAKDTNYQTLQLKMSLNNIDVPCDDRANAFVKFFDSKVTINSTFYNGKSRAVSNEVMFIALYKTNVVSLEFLKS